MNQHFRNYTKEHITETQDTSPLKGERMIPAMDKKDLDETLATLSLVAMFKSWLPFNLRGWVNILGLHVQERKSGQWTRLQAGGSLRSYLDAWREDNGNWQVRKFDRETWQRRFAHLVQPTCEIARFLDQRVHYFGSLDVEGAAALNNALQHYRATGTWSGLPEVSEDVINEELKERARAEAKEEHRIRIRLISNNERRIRKDPLDRSAWGDLSNLYFKEQRYKDMENALKMQLKADQSKLGFQSYLTYLVLGEVYFAALSTSIRGRGTPIWGYIPPLDIKPEVLGYTADQLRTLAIDNLSRAYELLKKASFKDSDPWTEEVERALKAADTLAIEAFGEFDIFKQHGRKQEVRQQKERPQESFGKGEDEGKHKDL
jgi:nucleoid DNA-binding protein